MTNPAKALLNWELEDAQAEPFGTGLINDTYLVTAADKSQYILQALNPVFEPEVNIDIDSLTRRLADKGNATQRLLPARDGQLWAVVDQRAWRLATFVPGVCLNMLSNESQAFEAGRLLGRFHAAIQDMHLELHVKRPGVHDTARHLGLLREALTEHSDHRYYNKIEPLARTVLEIADSLPALPELPARLVHGDPKISNLVFNEQTGAGVCMIDLDTIAYMPLPLELGDAIRSWCNPRGEDTQESNFRIDLFAASIRGYAEHAKALLLPGEWESFVTAARIIMIELSARFTRDALREHYFGWNEALFPDRSTHNQVRATGQLQLFRSLTEQASEAEAIVRQAFS